MIQEGAISFVFSKFAHIRDSERSSCSLFFAPRARTSCSWNLVGHPKISAPLNSPICPLDSDMVQSACSPSIRGAGRTQRRPGWERPLIFCRRPAEHCRGFTPLRMTREPAGDGDCCATRLSASDVLHCPLEDNGRMLSPSFVRRARLHYRLCCSTRLRPLSLAL